MKRASMLFLVLAACSRSEQGGPDAGAPRPCADTTRAFAFPTPAWQVGPTLSIPAHDAAGALLEQVRPAWAAQIPLVDGWPARPTIVLPLDGAATAIDGAGFSVLMSVGGVLASTQATLMATLSPDGKTAMVQPRDPFPPGAREVVLVVGRSAVTGAHALPACAPGGGPDPAYDAAMLSLPAGTEADLALPFRLASTHEDLENLWKRLSAAPVLQASRVEARTVSSFAAPPGVAQRLASTAALGLLELPAYADDKGVFHRDADGAPRATGTTRPGFIVALPSTGTAPYPFVLFQHGGSQDKSLVFQLAGPLAQAGFAFVAVDLPFHGDLSGGGVSPADFLKFDDLARTRDNFRQAVSNHMAVFTGVEALDTAVAPVLGVPRALDAARGFYMGLSLGGISGSMTFATTKNVRAAAVFVGAGGYPELVSSGLFSLFVLDIVEMPLPDRLVLLGLAETILEGADPLAYARRSEDREAPPRPVLFMQAIADPIVPEPASDQWARAFGADLALPLVHPVDGMAQLPLPASNNFAWTGQGPKATRLLVENPMTGTATADRHGGLIMQDYSQQMVAHCFSTLLANGACEIIDSGFAR